jgi:hypothetical protein
MTWHVAFFFRIIETGPPVGLTYISWIQLMQSWSQDCKKRPSFDAIVKKLKERVREMEDEDRIVPSRASESRAKKRKKKPKPVNERLSIETRLSTETSKKRPDGDTV